MGVYSLPEWRIRCDDCDVTYPTAMQQGFSDKRSAKQYVRVELGWSDRGDLWLCPNCARRRTLDNQETQ